MPDPILNPDEVVIRKAGGREYVDLGRIGAWLTLTNQRLIIQRLLGNDSSYPLSHITQTSEHEYWPSPFAFFPFKLLRIDFDNGGAVLFGLSELPAWIQAVEQAKASAPQMPYTSTPTYLPAQRSRSGMARWALIGMGAVSVMASCICVPFVFWILLNLNSR